MHAYAALGLALAVLAALAWLRWRFGGNVAYGRPWNPTRPREFEACSSFRPYFENRARCSRCGWLRACHRNPRPERR